MHFQVINDDFFNQLGVLLKNLVPEFNSVFDAEDGIYPILSEFGRFIIDNSTDETLMHKSFNFINTAIDNGKDDTENVIVTEIFEQIYTDDNMMRIAERHLNAKALEIFKRKRQD